MDGKKNDFFKSTLCISKIKVATTILGFQNCHVTILSEHHKRHVTLIKLLKYCSANKAYQFFLNL